MVCQVTSWLCTLGSTTCLNRTCKALPKVHLCVYSNAQRRSGGSEAKCWSRDFFSMSFCLRQERIVTSKMYGCEQPSTTSQITKTEEVLAKCYCCAANSELWLAGPCAPVMPRCIFQGLLHGAPPVPPDLALVTFLVETNMSRLQWPKV